MNKIKKAAGCFFIVTMIFMLASVLNQLTLNRTSQGCIQLRDFYKLEENTVDALFIGSSHVYYSVQTCKLYDDHGIASYLLASPGQPVWMSYYFLEEALKTQTPKLVVFDICTLYQKRADVGDSSWPSLISMKPSVTKWKAIQAVNSEGKQLDAVGAFFSFPYYHTRYADLTKQDFYNTKHVRYNGYYPDFTKMSKKEAKEWEQKNQNKTGFDKIGTITERTERYLRKLIELCEDRNVQLLVVNAPYANHTLEKQQAYNYIYKIIQEYGVPFLDANYDRRLDIDYAQDLFEPSHLNYQGSVKYTDYLAQIITDSFELPDRREDAQYRHWEKVSTLFAHNEINRRALKTADTLQEYVQMLEEMEDCVIVAFRDPGKGAAVYDNGVRIFAGRPNSRYFQHFDLKKADLAIRGSRGSVKVFVDKKAYAYTENGLNIVVYDKVAGRVIGGAGFDEEGRRI